MRRLLFIIALFTLPLAAFAADEPAGPTTAGDVNAAPFGTPWLVAPQGAAPGYAPAITDGLGRTSIDVPAGGALQVDWRLPRYVFKLVVKGPKLPNRADLRIQYWYCVWPDNGSGGWGKLDDPFNGKWIDAAADAAPCPGGLVYTFKPLGKDENPGIKETGFPYRFTYKVRVAPTTNASISQVEAYTEATWKTAELKLEWAKKAAPWNGKIEARDAVILPGAKSGKSGVYTRLKVKYADSPHGLSADRGQVIFRSAGWDGFSVFVDDVIREGGIYVRDIGAFVSDASKNLTYADWKRPADAWDGTIMEKAAGMPEQSLERAMKAMPVKGPADVHLGVPYMRQHFTITPSGSVTLWRKSLRSPGPDADRRPWTDEKLRYTIAAGAKGTEERNTRRYLQDGYLPVIHTEWDRGDFHVKQSALATMLLGRIAERGDTAKGDEPLVLLDKIELTNRGSETQTAIVRLDISVNVPVSVAANGLMRLGTPSDGKARQGLTPVRGLFDINGKGHFVSPQTKPDESPQIRYEVDLAPGESHTVFLNIPYVELLDDKELSALESLRYDRGYEEVVAYWKRRIDREMKYQVPDAILNNLFKANLWHVLITTDKDPPTGLYEHGAATIEYANYLNETGCVARSLEMRGEHEEAFRLMEPFLVSQGLKPLVGNFKSQKGLFYAAYPDPKHDPYTAQAYNMHHGWGLWLLSEHYKWTHDKSYLKTVAPKLIAGCDWITRERQATKVLNPDGSKPVEWGLAPAGDLEDVDEFLYYYATNAYYYLGMKTAAEVLAGIKHPDATRIKKDADAYRADILASIRESMATSPVVRIKDGTYIPYVPPRAYALTHYREGWIRESLYSSLHLLDGDVVEPRSQPITWMLQELEDNIFLSKESGYGVADKDQQGKFFDFGGFCIQPNLLGNATAHLRRDEVPNFLRVFFNTCSASLYPDVMCFSESVPTYGVGGGPTYKTPDESKFIWYMRQMLVLEEGDMLKLGMGVPRAWMSDGKTVTIEKAATLFGPMNMKITSRISSGRITASLDLPFVTPPKMVVLRLRHPAGKPMRRVTVNGKQWRQFNPAKEIVVLPTGLKHAEVTAYFESLVSLDEDE